MIAYFGTSYSDTLSYSNWDYNWNAFYMGAGNDSVTTPSTGVAYRFAGGSGNDYFLGDSGNDTAYGDMDNDTLSGWSGHDSLDGGAGNDTLRGGSGMDNLYGSTGVDRLNGGTQADLLVGGYDSSTDYFQFAKGDSNAVAGQFDTIYDWNVAYDYIDSSLAGRSNGYSEAATSATSLAAARSITENNASLADGDHTFLYNAATDTGYLLSDLDGNYTFETGVVIRGAGSAADMSWSDII